MTIEQPGLDIALIQPPGFGTKTPSLGLALLKSYLGANGLKAKVFDLNILLYNLRRGPYSHAWGSTPLYSPAGWASESFERRLYGFYSREILTFMSSVLAAKPRVIGFSAHYTSLVAARLLAAKFKQLSPGTKIIFGGPHFARQEEQWKDLLAPGCADAVVFGEGEEPLAQYLKSGRAAAIPGVAWRGPLGDIVDGGVRPVISVLDSLPHPDYSDFELAAYSEAGTLPTYFSRGCLNRCVFCASKQLLPGFRSRSGERVFEDVLHQLSAHPGTHRFEMFDSVSNGDIGALELFCDLLIANNVEIKFSLPSSVIRREMDTRLYRKLKRAGCTTIIYGLETPSKGLLKAIGKTLCLDADFDKVISEGAGAKLDVGVNMIFGLPGELPEDHEQQLAFLRMHKRERKRLFFSLGLCRFWPRSEMYQNAKAYGVDLSLGPVYWSLAGGDNAYTDRVAKLDSFCAEAGRLGYQNFCSAEAAAWRDRTLGDYYLLKGDKELALRYLRKAFYGGNNTSMESADRALGLYADLALEKDAFYYDLSRFKAEQAGDGRSDFEGVLSLSGLTQYLLNYSVPDTISRLSRLICAPEAPALRWSLGGIKKYLLARVRGWSPAGRAGRIRMVLRLLRGRG